MANVGISMEEFTTLQNQLVKEKTARYEAESKEKKSTAGTSEWALL